MPFDLKAALAKVPAEKRPALEAALAESQGFIDVLETMATSLETETKTRTDLEANLVKINEQWAIANDEYTKMVDDLDATEKEKKAAQKKIDEANAAKLEAEKKLAESLRVNPPVDTTKFLTQEQLDEKMRVHAIQQTAYFGETLDTVAEIERVTGKRVSPNALIQEAIAAKKTPSAYAEEKYELAKVREKAVADAQTKRDKDNEDKGYQRAIAESRNPALRTLESSDDPFYVPQTGDAVKQPWDEDPAVTPEWEQKLLKDVATIVQ